VIFTPPGGLEPGTAYYLELQAGDLSPVYSPAPYHHRNMRTERIAFTTEGFFERHGCGEAPREVPNKGVHDDSVMPTSIAFSARGDATPDGRPLLAHHYALLDSDMVHEHSTIFIHHPDGGKAHAILGYAGLVWGFSGMNEDGLVFAFNNSDSLDNPLVGAALNEIFEVRNLIRLLQSPDLEGLSDVMRDVMLLATGMPIGMAGRDILRNSATTEEALRYLYLSGTTYGWNVMLMDASGDMAVAEIDGAVMADAVIDPGETKDKDGFKSYRPDESDEANLDEYGGMWASHTADDLIMACHFQKNTQDMIDLSLMGMFTPRNQRFWTGFYFRSLRSFYVLKEKIEEDYGSIGVEQAQQILRTPELVDTRDSMNACVYEPAVCRMHWAMGGAPVTDLPFIELDLTAELKKGREE